MKRTASILLAMGFFLFIAFFSEGWIKSSAEGTDAVSSAADVLDADVFEIIPVEPYIPNDLNYHQPGNRVGR